jgi:hypothetical protein
MTEFGATRDIAGDLFALESLAAQMDRHSQSWMYWQFKFVIFLLYVLFTKSYEHFIGTIVILLL